MTAEEIITRRQQGLLIASPVLSRLYGEWLGPLITRTYRYMMKRKMVVPPPPDIAGKAMTIEYRSPMALAQKQSEIQNFIGAVTAANPLFTMDPGVAANLDADFAFREIFSMNAVDPRFLRRSPEVQAMRQQEARAQQAQQEAQLAAEAAGAAKDAASGLRDIAQAQAP